MTSPASSRGWGKGWPQNNSSKMVTVRSARSGVTLSVHRKVAPIVKWLMDETERRGYILDFGPKDTNDDWGYSNRPIAGTRTPSNHSWGLAVDLDAQNYPQGQRRRRPPAWVIDLWSKYGFDNGADWSYADPMHFEFRGTPKDADWLVASLAAHHVQATAPPVPTTAPALGSIKLGDKGPMVSALQFRLKALTGKPDVVDGDYGPATYLAVTLFQRFAKLPETGVADAKTQGTLDYFLKLKAGH